MDEDYAILSLEIGLFAGKADKHLRRSHFVPKTRAKCWEFTREWFDGLKIEARAMGVPDSAVEMTASEKSELPGLVRLGMAMQRKIDQTTLN